MLGLPEVTVTSLPPPRIRLLAVFLIKPTVLSYPFLSFPVENRTRLLGFAGFIPPCRRVLPTQSARLDSAKHGGLCSSYTAGVP